MHRILIFILLLACASNALAGGPYPAISGIAAAADDASVASTNPAAMTRFDRRVMRGEVAAFYSDNTWVISCRVILTDYKKLPVQYGAGLDQYTTFTGLLRGHTSG